MEGWLPALQALPLLALVVAGGWGFSQMTDAAFGLDPTRRPGIMHLVAAPGFYDLAGEVERQSALASGGAREAKVDLILTVAPSDELTPFMRWGLREHVNLRVLNAMAPDPAPIVVGALAPSERPENLGPPGEFYSGASFGVLQVWQPGGFSDFRQWWRWIGYREAKTNAEERQVLLWVDRSRENQDNAGTGARK